MGLAAETSERSRSSFLALLGRCAMHAEEPLPHETLEITGRVERLPVEGRFVVLVPRSGDRSITILELDVSDIESCDLLFEDSAARKTCRLVVSAGATLRSRYTVSGLRRELSAGLSGEDATDVVPQAEDPIAAWETAAWRSIAHESPALTSAPSLAPSQRAADSMVLVGAQSYAQSTAQPAYIESYQGQLYYYFPNGFAGDTSSVTGAALAAPASTPSTAASTPQFSYGAFGYGAAAPGGTPCRCAGRAGANDAQDAAGGPQHRG